VFAVTDSRRSTPVPGYLVPLVVFICILGIAVAFGMQTGMLSLTLSGPLFNSGSVGFAINPARDLGPRIMTAMVGYGTQGTVQLFQAIRSQSLIHYLIQSSVIAISTGSGLLFWALLWADCLPPLSMMPSSTSVRKVLLMRRE
jgi:hypothetical protein